MGSVNMRRRIILFVCLYIAFFSLRDVTHAAPYGAGTGEPNDPYQIWTAEQMRAIGTEPNDWDKHFKLMADIDWEQYGWSRYNSIGDSDSPFTGVFDGAGHAIANPFVLGGLFGYVRQEPLGDERSGIIRDLHLRFPRVGGIHSVAGSLVAELESGRIINCHVEGGEVEAKTCAGGLVSMVKKGATIERCTSSATVSAESRTEGRAGGLVGSNSGTISNCHAGGTVSAGFAGGGLAGTNSRLLLACDATADVKSDFYAGGLVGGNFGGTVSNCCASGSAWAGILGGGLTGTNEGVLTECYATGTVSADSAAGGLSGLSAGIIRSSFATGAVSDANHAGGLVGLNYGFPQWKPYLYASIANCYATGPVSGSVAGGLVGRNGVDDCVANISRCYATGLVSGATKSGGLVDVQGFGSVESSFWDRQTSAAGGPWGRGMTTAQMQTAATFLDAGWDFVDETANGSDDIWWIDEGHDYPRLVSKSHEYSGGTGEPNDPYRIATGADLIALGASPKDYDRDFILTADINLDPNLPGGKVFDAALIAPDLRPGGEVFNGIPFGGTFDGQGHTISYLTISGFCHLGLFGWLDSGATVFNLNLEAVDVNGPYGCYDSASVGGLAGHNDGVIVGCYCSGKVNGGWGTGGLVGSNRGHVKGAHNAAAVYGTCAFAGIAGDNGGEITTSCNAGAVNGPERGGGIAGASYGTISQCLNLGRIDGNVRVGGLVGSSSGGSIAQSYNRGSVNGDDRVGGLVGESYGDISMCYSTGIVTGQTRVGGLVGNSRGSVAASFWDVEASGQTSMCGQVVAGDGCDDSFGKTTAEMQDIHTYLDAGWDFVGETANGTDDIWWIDEGQDYPRLWWELTEDSW